MIIAHRGNIDGPNPKKENTLQYLLNAVNQGYGIETDLRYASDLKRLIISHDPAPFNSSIDASIILNTLIDAGAFIALNIKEDNLLDDLLSIINPKRFNGFLFDFELWCSDYESEIVVYKQAGFKIARRCSDRFKEHKQWKKIDYDYIWLDEMDEEYSISIFMLGLNPSKLVYVSPELHKRDINNRRKEKFPFICTDYCNYYNELQLPSIKSR